MICVRSTSLVSTSSIIQHLSRQWYSMALSIWHETTREELSRLHTKCRAMLLCESDSLDKMSASPQMMSSVPLSANALASGSRGCNNLWYEFFKLKMKDRYLEHSLWNHLELSAKRPYWTLVNIGSENGLVHSGNRPIPEATLTNIYDVTRTHWFNGNIAVLCVGIYVEFWSFIAMDLYRFRW